MILSSFLSFSEARVRITPELERAICEFSGTDKFAKALPNLELAIRAVSELHKDAERGCKFYEVDGSGECFLVNLDLAPVEIEENATARVRITKELESDIINLANQLNLNKEKKIEKFSEALPFLATAINMAKMLRHSIEMNSTFYMVEPDGEKCKVKFL